MTSNNMTSAVEEVRIFLHGAEIKRRMTLETSAGKNIAVFSGLPQEIRPESINASVEGGGSLICADFEKESFREPAVSKDIKHLTEKQERIRDEIREEIGRLNQLKTEEDFLDSNKKVGGKSGLTLDGLKEFEEYFIARSKEIGAHKIAAEKKMEELSEEMERVTKELSGYPSNVVRYAGKITVEFHAESEGSAEIAVSYFVNSAGWVPAHEIRIEDADSPVTLSMKGNIVQNTGEDWTDVRVRLSTGNPMLGNDQPRLRPWYVGLEMHRRPVRNAKAMKAEMKVAECEIVEECVEISEVEIAEAPAAVEFIIPAPLNIPSSNKPSKTEILRHVLEADLFHYCACRLDTDAFLLAKIGGWESLNMLAGEVSIFQGNDYVGKTFLDPARMEDGMEISLGRDRGIIVTREKGKDMVSKGLMGKDKKMLCEWIMTVRNTRSKDIRMKLLDQVPVPTDSAVTVNNIELSGAELEKGTGILIWSLNIPAGGSVRKVLRYEISCPKNGTVYLD